MLGSDDIGGLGFQLAMYRLMDSWKETRRIRDEGRNSYNLTAMTINYDRLAARYDDLVVQFNNLLDVSQKTARHADHLRDQVAARDREIVDLKRQLADAQAEIWDVRGKWARTSADMLDRMYKVEDELKALRSRQP